MSATHHATSKKSRAAHSPLRRVGFWAGPALFFTILFLADFDPDHPEVTRMAAVAVLMAVWWISDAIPLAATALLPLVLFPLLGIYSGKETAPIYVNDTIFLFVGGFMIALAMERWHLHKRIALWIIKTLGGGPERLVLSVMIATAALSMWISNTATAIMMLAIGLAVLSAEEENFGREKIRNLSASLLLGIAYSASVGGLATIVGTPPNLSLVRIFALTFPDAPPIGFGQWILIGIPICLIMLVFIWFLLTKVIFRTPSDVKLSKEIIHSEYRALGKMAFEEKVVFAVFVTTALLWVFRNDLQLGAFTLPGWGGLLPFGSMLSDGTVAIAMALVLFLVPARHESPEAESDPDSRGVLGIGVFRKIPWHIVLLFGGGFALAKGFQTSGLSQFIGQKFAGLEGASPSVLVAAICTMMTFLTELTSNTATTEMVLPILASIGVAAQINPLVLMIPAALSASCAFMMPVATPPNAIVFGANRFTVARMARTGFGFNIAAVILVIIAIFTLGDWVFGASLEVFPDWARAGN